MLLHDEEKYPPPWNQLDALARAYADRGENDRAIHFYRESLKLNPKNDWAKRKLQEMGAEGSDAKPNKVASNADLLVPFMCMGTISRQEPSDRHMWEISPVTPSTASNRPASGPHSCNAVSGSIGSQLFLRIPGRE